jgi:hypothetical protein
MAINNPYEGITNKGQWNRGNLHMHSTRSDGKRDVQVVIDDYTSRGYDFLMFSDHDIFTSKEDYKQWDSRGLVMIPGNEITRNGVHMLHVNASSKVEPDKDRQVVIDQIIEDGGFCVVNHPNWFPKFNHCTQEQMQRWQGYMGIEIYNGVIGLLDGSPYATNHWDMLLSSGRKVWGFANDDSHDGDGQVALGWNMVYADKSCEAIVDAMMQGRFYGSTGVTIEKTEVNDDEITIGSSNAQRIVAITDNAQRVKQVDGQELTVKMPENKRYLRFELWGPGESFAWTQPFFSELTL